MKKHETAASATYTPQTFKTFEGALFSFFREECPQMGGDRTRQTLVQVIAGMVRKFYPETSHLSPGQIVWPTVHKKEKGSYGKRICDSTLTTVILDLVLGSDALDRAKGKRLREMKKEAVARLCKQCYQQDGCITNAELAVLLKISAATVGKYIAEWEWEHKEVLPRRGTIHDMGPSLTHKRIIIHKLFMEQKSVQQTARETSHSLPAIQRYISGFRQILLCSQKNMTTEEIAYATKKTVRLVKEYEKIIEEFKENNYILQQLLSEQPYIESNAEVWVNEYGKDA